MSKMLLPAAIMTFAVIAFSSGQACGSRLEILLLTELFPESDSSFIQMLGESLKSEGFNVRFIDADALINELSKPPKGRLLVLPNSACFPVGAKGALVNFAKGGGNLLMIGGPALSRQVVKVDGEWLTETALLERLATMPAHETLLDFAKVKWSADFRDTGTPDTAVEVRTIATGIAEAPSAMELHAQSVKFWEFQDIPVQQGFPPDDSVTVFWAKASENARRCIVAWLDKDGARWFTHIPLSTSWTRYALPSGQFRHWKGPGKADDRIDLTKVVKFKVGFEHQSLRDSNQPVTLWVSDVRSARNPAGNPDFSQPLLETLSPTYKTYETSAAALVRTFGSYFDLPAQPAFEGPLQVVCSLPRYRGMGFNKTAPHRWIPYLAVRMSDGHIGGAGSAFYVQDDDQYKGTVWGMLGIKDASFLASNRRKIVDEICRMVRRIDEGIFLLSAGTDRASYFDGNPLIGAVVLNLGTSRAEANLQVVITGDPEYCRNLSPSPTYSSQKSLTLTEGRNVVEFERLPHLAPGFYVATASLYIGERLVDQIRQPFSVIESKPVNKDELVTIKGDLFYYKGKPWYSLGINYRPLYVASLESEEFWKYWTHPDQYDPEIIEIELDLMNKIGLNTVALIYPDKDSVAPALVDFMERAHRHGLKCHVYISGLEPMSPKPQVAERLITAAKLWENPAMFAYDLGWEVRIGREEKRQAADEHWKRWIEDRYGSIENAEKDWGFSLRKDAGGRIHGPTDEQVMKDGPWRRMVAAYRRFWDDRISRQYMKNREVMKRLDPYHPISVRSGFGGTGTLAPYAVPQMPVDLFSGAKHLDYISPEGYNFSGDFQSFRECGFTTLYGKFVSSGKPIYWAELGYSVSGNPTPETLENQRQYYEKIYRVFHETRSAGSAAWWWPGYLIWEESDFAVINPDFTLRPAAHEFTKMAKMVRNLPPQKKPDYWIEIDRDLYTNGYAGLLADKRAEYGKAVSEGRTVGLRTKATGTDTSNFPRVAIGGTPLNGKNAPEYLNAEFNWLEILDASGRWVRVEDGDRVAVKPDSPVIVRASVGNTNEVKWLAKGKWAVYLQATINDQKVFAPISRDTKFLDDAEVPPFELTSGISNGTRVSFQMVTGDIVFGEKRYVTLELDSKE